MTKTTDGRDLQRIREQRTLELQTEILALLRAYGFGLANTANGEVFEFASSMVNRIRNFTDGFVRDTVNEVAHLVDAPVLEKAAKRYAHRQFGR